MEFSGFEKSGFAKKILTNCSNFCLASLGKCTLDLPLGLEVLAGFRMFSAELLVVALFKSKWTRWFSDFVEVVVEVVVLSGVTVFS